jgi:sarcosine oxidase
MRVSERGCDVLVAGLGAMGSAVAYHLARRGARVVGIDRYAPPHDRGSTHGESRIIREAYYEGPEYVPLVQRAYELWEELERDMGRSLLTRTGALMLGAPESELIRGSRRSAEEHGIPHELLDREALARRFPIFSPGPETVGLLEARGGVLDPEACVRAHLDAARAHGAVLRTGEPMIAWSADAHGVAVLTSRGRLHADHLVLAVGPWLPELVPGLPLEVERQVMLWFEPRVHPEAFAPGWCPVFLWETDPDHLYYGFPDLGSGVKVARHHGGETGRVDELEEEVLEEDVEQLRGFLRRHLPAADGRLLRGAVCRYTNTPDHHFLLARHPDHPRVHLVSPCSGHGFKFASAIGERTAEEVMG